MASLSFDGTTFWNDATSGVGRLFIGETLPRRDFEFRRLPSDNGKVAVDLGEDPGIVTATGQYRLSSGDFSTLMSAINGKVGSYGDVAWSSDIESRTVSGCVMHPAPQVNRGAPVIFNGNTRRIIEISFTFTVLAGRS